MPNIGPTELIIIAVVIILLFGAKKLPDMARSLGRSAKIFKAETKGLRDDDEMLMRVEDLVVEFPGLRADPLAEILGQILCLVAHDCCLVASFNHRRRWRIASMSAFICSGVRPANSCAITSGDLR